MRPPLAQADIVSAVVGCISFALMVVAHLAAQTEHRGRTRAAVFDAWRLAALFSFYASCIFWSSILDPRMYADDYQEIGLRPLALWGGALACGLVFAANRLREARRLAAHYDRGWRTVTAPEGPCGPCGPFAQQRDERVPTSAGH